MHSIPTRVCKDCLRQPAVTICPCGPSCERPVCQACHDKTEAITNQYLQEEYDD